MLATALVLCASVIACTGYTNPEDCDGIVPSVCHSAESLAESGLFLKPGQAIAGWRVRPTQVALCPPDGQPLVDVTFELEGRTAIVITVGQLADGRLAVCTF